MKLILTILAFILVAISINAIGIKGLITNTIGEPIPYATIYVKEASIGTTSNHLGEYEINLPKGEYRLVFKSLGYQQQEQLIKITDQLISKNITLKDQSYTLGEVIVTNGKEDPAYRILRKAISLAPYYLNQTEHYTADVYLKGTLEMEKIPYLIKKMIEKETEGETIKEGKTYVLETVNKIEYTAPDKFTHTVLSKRSTFPESEDNDVMGYINASFYKPINGIHISPLAHNAFAYYKYRYEGYFEEGDNMIYKIKIIPKRKSKQVYSGYIYIVDGLWNIHSTNVNTEAFFGTVNIKQVYAPVKDNAWLPISHQVALAGSIMGVKGKYNYAGSVKYQSIDLNTGLKVPPILQANIDETQANEKVNEEKAPSKNRQKIEKLFAKEELNNRDMVKLAKLMQKESKQTEDEPESLEVKETYTIKHQKDSIKRDAAYWNSIRPIPLTLNEEKGFIIKDSMNLKTIAQDTISHKQKKKSLIGKTYNFLHNDKNFYSSDSSLQVKYKGLAKLANISFNAVDGFTFRQKFELSYRVDSNRTFFTAPTFQYAFARKTLNWENHFSYSFAPDRRAKFYSSFGQKSQDFNYWYGIDPTLNMITALGFKEHYMKLYQRNYITVGQELDLFHGARLYSNVTYIDFKQLENTTNFSLYKNDEAYEENIPDNPILTEKNLNNQQDLSISIQLDYTPKLKYRMIKGRKQYLGSNYPTFKLRYQRSFDKLLGSDAKHEYLETSANQTINWGIFHSFKWSAKTGYFLRNEQMHFSQFAHFNALESPVVFRSLSDNFTLLNNYEASTNKWFTEAHAAYSSPYLLIKHLPFFSNRLWNENIKLSYLTTPDYKNYNEIGYGISNIFFMANVGIFAGFEDGKYTRWGMKLGLNF